MDTYVYVDSPSGEIEFQVPLDKPLSIALKEICYVVGYHNVSEALGNNLVHYTKIGGDNKWVETVADGFYNLKTYEKALQDIVGKGLRIKPLSYNGRVSMSVALADTLISFRDNNSILGLDSRNVELRTGESIIGESEVRFLNPKQLFIHCPQINKVDNLYNGNPTDLLEVLPVTTAQYGAMVSYSFIQPSFKRLSSLHRLSLHIRDENGKHVDFHDQYIRYTLILRE